MGSVGKSKLLPAKAQLGQRTSWTKTSLSPLKKFPAKEAALEWKDVLFVLLIDNYNSPGI